MDDVTQLAFEIADEAAMELVESSSVREVIDGIEWRDLTDLVELEGELRYLELRGLLLRHPDRPRLVRIWIAEEELTAES